MSRMSQTETQTMKKHKYNIFPEAKSEDFNRLVDDIRTNGYDSKQPIILYQGEIIDGWNRQRACDKLGVKPIYENFTGNDSDAVALVMRTNKRRNLNSGQWACIAAEADDLLAVIREQVEKERREKQAVTQRDPRFDPAANVTSQANRRHEQYLSDKKLSDNQPQRSTEKAAELFNTNRTYINQAVKMKEKAPEVFQKVKEGKMTMQDANKAVRAIPACLVRSRSFAASLT